MLYSKQQTSTTRYTALFFLHLLLPAACLLAGLLHRLYLLFMSPKLILAKLTVGGIRGKERNKQQKFKTRKLEEEEEEEDGRKFLHFALCSRWVIFSKFFLLPGVFDPGCKARRKVLYFFPFWVKC